LLALALVVAVVYFPLLQGEMPWAVGQADHPTHQYQAWLFVERLLASGRLSGWSDLRWAGYPALELYPMGGPLWVGLWRALTLGQLDWESTYALALFAMVLTNVIAVYVVTRRCAGPGAALVAALLVLFERGSARQGGDYYAIDVGVWPVTMGIGPFLVTLERLWTWLELQVSPRENGRRRGARVLVGACCCAGWALLCHPMYLPLLLVSLPTLALVSLWRQVPIERAVAGAAMTWLVGWALAAFWYVPFMETRGLSEPGGTPFRSLNNLGEAMAFLSWLPRYWELAAAAGLAGLVLALRRGGALAFWALLALILIVVASSTPLELAQGLTGLSGSVQQERFFIPLRVVWCLLAGFGLARLAQVVLEGWRDWTFRHRVAAAGCVALLGLLAAPAVEGLVKYLARPVVEFDRGRDLAHRRDLLALCDWLRAETPAVSASSPPPRTAWYVGYGHHEYNNAPIFCGLAQVIETPAETFAIRPGGISERELRAFGVRWVVADREMDTAGRYGHLRYLRSFGQLRLYELGDYQPRRWTMLGQGQVQLEHFSDELIRFRLSQTAPDDRLAVHVTRHPRWQATLNGRPVAVAGGHLGLPRADLIHVPVEDGVMELRYRRGWAHWLGACLTLLAALWCVLFGVTRGQPKLLLGRESRDRRRSSPPSRQWGPTLGRRGLVALWVLAAMVPLLALAVKPHGGARGVALARRQAQAYLGQGPRLASLLPQARAWLFDADGLRQSLKRRWDGRLGRIFPPEVRVDRHVEAIQLGDPRRVLAIRAAPGEEVHVCFTGLSLRGVRGWLARGGSGVADTRVALWLDGRRQGLVVNPRLGKWQAFEVTQEEPARQLELVVRVAGGRGRAVLLDAVVLP
jgi:hypothetical protein